MTLAMATETILPEAARTIALEIRNLSVGFQTPGGVAKVLDGVSFSLADGRTTCLVGESGSGKSVTARAILRLNPTPPATILGGSIEFEGANLLQVSTQHMRAVRGGRISMIFQEPMTSLNPLFTVGEQIAEAIRVHRGLGRREAKQAAIDMLRLVHVPQPEERVEHYPHQFSGGMRQRVMIAIALSCNPRVLIADEPTTALDVTIQARILDTLTDLQQRFGMTVMLVTHDLGVVAERADDVVVMYAGRVVESSPVKELFANPGHPYTIGLLNALPRLGSEERLVPIAGAAPSPFELTEGCRFRDRCPRVQPVCATVKPELVEKRPAHAVACHFA